MVSMTVGDRTMISKRIAAAVAMMATTVSIANANDIATLVKFANDDDKTFQALILGAARSLEAVNILLDQEGQRKFFCTPDNLIVTGDQYMRILTEYVDKNPKIGTTTVNGLGYVMIIAMKNVFPCEG